MVKKGIEGRFDLEFFQSYHYGGLSQSGFAVEIYAAPFISHGSPTHTLEEAPLQLPPTNVKVSAR